jgi:hypothetical protein
VDLFCTLHYIHQLIPNTSLTYEWVKGHQDSKTPWLQLDLPAQLNITCNRLADKAVTRMLCTTTHPAGPQLLPFENIAIILDSKKVTSGVSPAISFALGRKEARRFYTAARHSVQGSNMGGLGWSEEAFDKVDWKALEQALNCRPNRFQLWLSKQAIGICATQKKKQESRIYWMAGAPTVVNKEKTTSTSTPAQIQGGFVCSAMEYGSYQHGCPIETKRTASWHSGLKNTFSIEDRFK